MRIWDSVDKYWLSDSVMTTEHAAMAQAFSCHNPDRHYPKIAPVFQDKHAQAMDGYLRDDALKYNDSLIQETYVFLDKSAERIVAYYTISMTAVKVDAEYTGLPKGMYPSVFFNNLAVDRRYTGGRQLGTQIYRALLSEAAHRMRPAPRLLYGEAYLERASFYVGPDWDELEPVIQLTGLRDRIEKAVGGMLLVKKSSNDIESEEEQQKFLDQVVASSPLLTECGASFVPRDAGDSHPVRLEGFGNSRENVAAIQRIIRKDPVAVCNDTGFFLQDLSVPFVIDLKKARRVVNV